MEISMTQQGFVGTWTFVREEFQREEDGSIFPDERQFAGMLMYMPSGHMSIILRRTGIANDVPLAADEFFAYYGTYQVNEQTINHHVLGSYVPAWVGNDQVRTFVFEGDTLTLITPPGKLNGENVRRRLVWQRAGG
jgi:hypothetical protein